VSGYTDKKLETYRGRNPSVMCDGYAYVCGHYEGLLEGLLTGMLTLTQLRERLSKEVGS
jgi:hypothetical protein